MIGIVGALGPIPVLSGALNAMTTGHGKHDIRFVTTRGSLSTVLLGWSWRYRLAELNFHLTNQADWRSATVATAIPLPVFAVSDLGLASLR
jgi:hypothetical protein